MLPWSGRRAGLGGLAPADSDAAERSVQRLDHRVRCSRTLSTLGQLLGGGQPSSGDKLTDCCRARNSETCQAAPGQERSSSESPNPGRFLHRSTLALRASERSAMTCSDSTTLPMLKEPGRPSRTRPQVHDVPVISWLPFILDAVDAGHDSKNLIGARLDFKARSVGEIVSAAHHDYST